MAMSITRIFRVRIDNAFRQEFEDKFSSIALYRIREAAGFISASIHKPTKWAPDEYAMISQCENEASLKTFFGEDWSRAVITRGAEKFIVACWVHHYESWGQA
jgi:heme-degrading monooxygenase HmoA